MQWVTPAEGLGGEGKGTGSPETIANGCYCFQPADPWADWGGAPLMPARHVAPGIHGPVMGNLGGKASLKLPRCMPTSPWPCRCACTAGSVPSPRWPSLCSTLPCLPASLLCHNELSMWNFSVASEIGICSAVWLGGLFWGWGGELERPLPSSGQLRMLVLYVSYQAEHNTALSCGVYNWTCCFVSAWVFFFLPRSSFGLNYDNYILIFTHTRPRQPPPLPCVHTNTNGNYVLWAWFELYSLGSVPGIECTFFPPQQKGHIYSVLFHCLRKK